MPYLVGTDEAGYGPNFGPLTISATVWHVPDGPQGVDLYERLSHLVTALPTDGDDRIAVADSKVLYKPGYLRDLECGVLTALGCVHQVPRSGGRYWQLVQADPQGQRRRWPWCDDHRTRLPLDLTRDQLQQSIERFRLGLEKASVRLVAVRSTAIFPDQFNRLIERDGGKGAALSGATLRLLGEVLKLCDEPALVVCDKHGGRNRYGRLLQQQFPDWLVEVHGESAEESAYRWGPVARRVDVRFRTRGEAFLPTALASMACKYLRELSMRAFNKFWCRRVPNLRPTAGYPTDARRFRKEISAVQQQLGIDDHVLWRNR